MTSRGSCGTSRRRLALQAASPEIAEEWSATRTKVGVRGKVIRPERVVGHSSRGPASLRCRLDSYPVVYGGGRYAPVRVAHPGVRASKNRHRANLTSSLQWAASAMSTVAKQDRRLRLFNQRLVGKNLEIALRGLDANHVLGHEDSKQFQLSVHPEVCIRRAGPAEFTCRAG